MIQHNYYIDTDYLLSYLFFGKKELKKYLGKEKGFEEMSQECEDFAEELNEIRREVKAGKKTDSDSLAKELGL